MRPHNWAVQRLITERPNVALLTGRASVGRRTIAKTFFEELGLSPYISQDLNMEVAREFNDWATKAGGAKGYILHATSDKPQHAILKTIEDFPSKSKFVVVVSSSPLPTISSRARVRLDIGPLNHLELEHILVSRGVPLEQAKKVSHAGTVQLAEERLTPVEPNCVSLLTALERGDRVLLEKSMEGLPPTVIDLIITWANIELVDKNHDVRTEVLTHAGARREVAETIVQLSVSSDHGPRTFFREVLAKLEK